MKIADADHRMLLALRKSTRRSVLMTSFVASASTRPTPRLAMAPAPTAMRRLVPKRMRSRLPSDYSSMNALKTVSQIDEDIKKAMYGCFTSNRST